MIFFNSGNRTFELRGKCQSIDNAVKSSDFAQQQNRNMVLIHANEYVEEYRWRDN